MKKRFWKLAKFRIILTISLFLAMAAISGLGISCQYQAPVNPTPSPAPGESTPAPPAQVEVVIEGFAFKPDVLNISVGTIVIWRNNDAVAHTVTARDNSFDSGNMAPNATFSHLFEQSGTFDYYCRIHPSMTGKVIVE